MKTFFRWLAMSITFIGGLLILFFQFKRKKDDKVDTKEIKDQLKEDEKKIDVVKEEQKAVAITKENIEKELKESDKVIHDLEEKKEEIKKIKVTPKKRTVKEASDKLKNLKK